MTKFVPRTSKPATFTLALTGIAFRAIAQIFVVLKNRRQIARLADLDDRALKDIGLIRSDVDAALTLPLHMDPSHHLREVSGHAKGGYRSENTVQPLDLNRVRCNAAAVTAPHLQAAGI
ncbi:MAG: DUF1127 domain-containing protein [Beijerinckiaceae bacterium]